jgi:hypothetical protein
MFVVNNTFELRFFWKQCQNEVWPSGGQPNKKREEEKSKPEKKTEFGLINKEDR